MFTIITLPNYADTASGLYPNSSALFTDLLPFMVAILGVSLVGLFLPAFIENIKEAIWKIVDRDETRIFKEAMLRGIDDRQRDLYNAKIDEAYKFGYQGGGVSNKLNTSYQSLQKRQGKIIDAIRKRRATGSYVDTSRGRIPIEDF